jgi:hypothetical protein
VVGASEGGLRKSTSVTSVCLFQTLGEAGSELDTPETDRFVAYGYTALGQQIFNISMAKVEPVVEPDCIADDFGGPPRCGNRWRLYVFIPALSRGAS